MGFPHVPCLIKKYLTTQNIEEATEKKLGRFKQIFTKDQELELAAYVKDIESRFFGLTTKDMRILAFDLADKNNIKHNFDTGKKMAGRIWLEKIIKRNPELSLRKPEATSAARASGLTKLL
ncbi:unnamed protein product [Arctia plantaginis]|uniref:Uncharacterized protein n=1 Tax=Arctia plantaginis TaxID=874455 RepID=A0A8S1B620_ARCPL|nr:unnamed protein product [Arctia plantaginis]